MNIKYKCDETVAETKEKKPIDMREKSFREIHIDCANTAMLTHPLTHLAPVVSIQFLSLMHTSSHPHLV